MDRRGWEQCDFVYVIGDAYVDHSTFGHAIISRVLEDAGYKVGIISQPDWKDPSSILALGEPRLAFLVMGGNMDSMVNHYSVSKKRRRTDAFTPGGVTGKRPDHATVVYCNLIRRSFPHKPIIVGGIEASLRRLAHYDYWSDSLKRSLLLDAQADLLLYGMGERSIVEVAEALDSGLAISDITYVRGSVYKTRSLESVYDALTLPSWEALNESRRTYAESFYTQYCNTDPFVAKRLVEPYEAEGCYVVQNPPQEPLTTAEMDHVYALPYMRTYHPSYKKLGGVPAIEEVKFSLTSNRGCFGGCSFCALAFHQGRMVTSRSHESVIREVTALTKFPDFKGYINDVGGPSANFRHHSCKKQAKCGMCADRRCLAPTPCPNLDADHSDYLALLRKLRQIPGIKKVFVRSGIRYDYMLEDKNDDFFAELVKYHISGQLKVAPEHCIDGVLDYMGKPHIDVYERFMEKYKKMNTRFSKEQYVVPYLMSSHPGSTLSDAVALAEYLNKKGRQPEQVQDFYPTPGTISTCMYYTGIDPMTMKSVYVAKTFHEKAMQRALLQWKRPDKRKLVIEALKEAGREDLIGYGPECLVRPDRPPRQKAPAKPKEPEKPQMTKKAGYAKGWAKPKPKKSAKPGKKKGR